MAYEENEEKAEEPEEKARFVRERARRELRKKQRRIRKEEKAELGRASGTRDRRSIKEDADAALEKAEFKFNEKYKPSENKQDYESDIQQRGTDQFTAPEATPENGNLLSGYSERSVILCEDGSPVNGTILFRT